MGADRLTLRLDNAIGSIETGRLALDAYLAGFPVSDRALNRLEVIFEELISNIVRHGGGAEAIVVEASYDTADAAITLCVEDDGRPFDPLGLADPPAFGRLEDAALGGLGIPLIKRLARSVSYARVASDQGARNRVVAVIAG